MSEKKNTYGGFATPDSIAPKEEKEDIPFPKPPEPPEKNKNTKKIIIAISLIAIIVIVIVIVLFACPREKNDKNDNVAVVQTKPTSQPVNQYNENGFHVQNTKMFLIDQSILPAQNRDTVIQAIAEAPDSYSSVLYENADELIHSADLMDYVLVYAVYFKQNSPTKDAIERKIVICCDKDKYDDTQTLDWLLDEGVMYIDLSKIFDSSCWHAGVWSVQVYFNEGLIMESQLKLVD